jgi:MYXO-CTERM domain-containing protein
MRRGWVVALLAAWSVPATSLAHSPDATYRWVGDDEAPGGRRAELGGDVTSVWTPDLQAVLSLPGADGVDVELQPRAATDLPEGLHPDGNAYEIRGAGDGVLELAVPHEATGAVYSADGRRWTPVPFETSAGEVTVDVGGDGLYLAVTDHDVRATSTGRTPPALVAGPPLVLLALLAVRRRRREPVTA